MKAFQVAPASKEKVEPEKRRYMTLAEKIQRWVECDYACSWCGRCCTLFGPEVVWDHRVALALGGTNELSNMEPHHALVCAPAKTAKDRKAIAKAARLRAREDGTRRPRKAIPSRSFDKRLTRSFRGKGVGDV